MGIAHRQVGGWVGVAQVLAQDTLPHPRVPVPGPCCLAPPPRPGAGPQEIISRVLRDAGNVERLDLASYKAALADADLSNMVVEVPIELDSRN